MGNIVVNSAKHKFQLKLPYRQLMHFYLIIQFLSYLVLDKLFLIYFYRMQLHHIHNFPTDYLHQRGFGKKFPYRINPL